MVYYWFIIGTNIQLWYGGYRQNARTYVPYRFGPRGPVARLLDSQPIQDTGPPQTGAGVGIGIVNWEIIVNRKTIN